MSRIFDLALDESRWLAFAISLSTLAVLALCARPTWRAAAPRTRVLWAMNLFYACTIGTMSCGHLLAVGVKAARGTLEGSLAFLVPLGLVLFVPACWLALRVGRYARDGTRSRVPIVALNAWLGASLLAFGIHNFPLAVTAALDIAYALHSRRAAGWTIAALMVAANVALFIGSIVFMLSGQSFEQLQGM